MFLENKYFTIYNNIINRAISMNFNSREEAKKYLGYVERHHIVPKSLGGNDQPDNLIYLTAREHFICHMLLPRFTKGDYRKKMIFAINKMTRKSKNQNRHIPKSHQYQQIRINFAKSIGDELRGKKRKSHSEEHRQSLSDKMSGVPKTENTIKNMISSWDNLDRKQKLISRNNEHQTFKTLWKDDNFRNKMIESVSNRQKERMSDPMILAESLKKLNSKKTCETCNMTTNSGNYKRWHGEKCKKAKALS